MRFLRMLSIVIICCASIPVLSAWTDLRHIPQVQVGPDGVQEIVSRARRPLPPPWRLIEELVIGVEYGDDDYMIRAPRNFTVLDNGTIVLLDDNPMQLRVYDRDGTYLRSFGQTGQGPTDLQIPWRVEATTLMPAGADRFEIRTGWPIRKQTWDIRGELISVETMRDDHPLRRGIGPHWVEISGQKLFSHVRNTRREVQEELITTSVFTVSDWAGTRLDTLRTQEHTPFPIGVNWYREFGGPASFDHILCTNDGRVYVNDREQDWVWEIDPETGKELRRFRWEHENDSYTDHSMDNPNPDAVERVKEGFEFLKETTSIMRLAEGPDGEVWVQRIEWMNGGGPLTLIHDYDEGTWPTDVFSSDGEYRGRMMLPYEPWRQLVIGDRIYAIGSIGDGVPAIIKYRLEPAR